MIEAARLRAGNWHFAAGLTPGEPTGDQPMAAAHAVVLPLFSPPPIYVAHDPDCIPNQLLLFFGGADIFRFRPFFAL